MILFLLLSNSLSLFSSRAQEYAKTKAADCSPLPSIVVCPPTLTGHWVDEVGKFCSKEFLNPLHYTGPPSERMRQDEFSLARVQSAQH